MFYRLITFDKVYFVNYLSEYMTKRKIKFDGEALNRLIDRVTAHGKGTRTDIITAMNADNDDDKKKVSLNQLSVWANEGKPFKLARLISLVNNMEGVCLDDFFVYEDDGQEFHIQPHESRCTKKTKTEEFTTTDQPDIEAVRQEYERKLANLERLMQGTIDAQRETIEAQKITIEALSRGGFKKEKDGDYHTHQMAAEP